MLLKPCFLYRRFITAMSCLYTRLQIIQPLFFPPYLLFYFKQLLPCTFQIDPPEQPFERVHLLCSRQL